MDLPKISAPATRALSAQGISKLEDLTQFTYQELTHLHGMGPKALEKLEIALSEANLSLKPE